MASSSPFPPSTSSPGVGRVIVEVLPSGISTLSRLSYQYPLKLISPSSSLGAQKSALLFLLTYGGGLIAGDQVHLTISVLENARLSIVTQGHTKIFKSPSKTIVTRQKLDVAIMRNAALCLLPDPVQPFKGCVYQQVQVFTLKENASLCLLDWVSSGREARGELWSLSSWSSRNEVWSEELVGSKPRLLLRDNIFLEGEEDFADIGKELHTKMHNLSIFGTLVLRGPLLSSLIMFFMDEFKALPRIGSRDFRSQQRIDIDQDRVQTQREIWRAERLKQEQNDAVLWSVATVRSCTVVKFGSATVEGARHWIRRMLNEEGSILEEFGFDSLLCVR